MKLEITSSAVIVTLSKRNLLALLQKVDDPCSGRTLVSGNAYRAGARADDVQLTVCCEPDERHYADRPPPGPVHPKAEAFIEQAPSSNGARA